MGHERIDLGARGEALAAGYLLGRGWEILAHNWRCSRGEVDLVARDPEGVVVICEVKTRSGTGYGSPLEAITYAKAVRLRRLAAEWARSQDRPVEGLRVDALGIVIGRDQVASIEHIQGIEP